MRSIAELERSTDVTPHSLQNVLRSHALRGEPVNSTEVIRLIDRINLNRADLIVLRHITEKGARKQRDLAAVIPAMEYERVEDHVMSLQSAS